MTQISATAASCDVEPARPPKAAIQRIALPCRLGDWQLVRLVAEGELTLLYQARPAEASGNQPAHYAVKLLRECWHNSPQAVDCLQREALLGRRVSHAHLIPVLAAHISAPPYYLVMPWLHGSTLAARLAAGDRPAATVALWVVRQIAQALDALHQAGWMHADIKPSNVFVSPAWHITLLDLGFARRPEETAAAERSIVERPVLGTMHYVAPEVITSVWGADIRSDIYSLGVLLYELLGARLPFPGDDLGEIVRAQRQARPAYLRRLAPQIPKEVARLVHQMLAKDPLRRPQSPRELIERLVPLEIATLPDRSC